VDADDHLPLRAPYAEHATCPRSGITATRRGDGVERLLAHELGVDWTAYEEALDAAQKRAPRRKP